MEIDGLRCLHAHYLHTFHAALRVKKVCMHTTTGKGGATMAIHVFCPQCKGSNALNAKACSKCGSEFGRSKKYRVTVSHRGERFTKVLDNLSIARAAEADVKRSMQSGEFNLQDHRAKKKTVLLNDLWERFTIYAQKEKDLKCWRTDKGFYRKHLQPRFGDKPLSDITPVEIERVDAELKKGVNARGKPYAAQTRKHVIVLLRRLFNLAVKWDMFAGPNPVSKVDMPKVDNQVTEFLSDEESSRLLTVLESWPCRESAAFVKLAMFTGLRRGEIIKLQWEHVDIERGLVTLVAPKGGKTTTLPLSNEALDVLRGVEVRAAHVFPGKDGGERYDFKGPWARIRKAAELPEDFRFHGLRHNFASTLVSNGVALAIVRDLLTHKDLTMTQRYAHLDPAKMKAAAMESGKLLTPKKRPMHLFPTWEQSQNISMTSRKSKQFDGKS